MLQNCLQEQAPIQLPQTTCAIRPQVSLAPLTTLRVGGIAQWYSAPRDPLEMRICLDWAKREGFPITLLGAGSNLLISDQGLPGLVLSSRYLRGSVFDEETGQVTASAGEPLPRLAWAAARRGWEGLEWAAGIPGTVGGAVVMNAGAQGHCTADILVQAQVVDRHRTLNLTPQHLNYRYRTSCLQGDGRLVTQATFQLRPGADPQTVMANTSRKLDYRKSTQPYHLPSCGSVFRNPDPAKAAGWLIENTGLKGYQIGSAQVAHRHANFIINQGGATATDVFQLLHHVQTQVWQKWSLRLEPEVRILGNFPTLLPTF
ncbi:UDP-N-acetylmuramate dehydrogenase [Prochlorothrix hollandica]|uniref:UDP-N-acetylmuramate dehydrogenase n=1 Tax=Prochlorothrix hollandica TaxID=1223 RepID=UPI0033420BF7